MDLRKAVAAPMFAGDWLRQGAHSIDDFETGN
jgi:hypothetical protein